MHRIKEKRIMNRRFSRAMVAVGGGFIGLVVFLLIYGVSVLNVTRDGWILAGYDEPDIVQRYVGWTNYRNAPWDFPLAKTTQIGYPSGGIIVFMDSMPIIALFFKFFSPLLPGTFQFEGIYMLMCFVLQGAAAALLIHLFVDRRLYVFISTGFFVLSPILLERGFRHSSLASHYLILFAMYYYFKTKKAIFTGAGPMRLPWIPMMVLSIFSVGVTPYFLPMVMIFVLLTTLDFAAFSAVPQRVLKGIGFFLANIAVALATSYVLGSFGHNVNASREGYGFFAMNWAAPFNPNSLGGYTWSRFLPKIPFTLGHYDGFNYLGTGVLAMLVFVSVAGAAMFLSLKNKKDFVRSMARQYGFLFAACAFLTLFAVSHVWYWGETALLTIPLPQPLLVLCGIFRASSRLFYPVAYTLFLFGIVATHRILYKRFQSKQVCTVVLSCFLALQMFDLSGVLWEKHQKMKRLLTLSFDGPAELLALEDYLFLVVPTWGQRYNLYISGKNNLITNGYDANSGSALEYNPFVQEQLTRLNNDKINMDCVYATFELPLFESWKAQYSDRADFYIWENTLAEEGEERHWPGTQYYMVPRKSV